MRTNRHCYEKDCECNTSKVSRKNTHILTLKGIVKHANLPEFATQKQADDTLNELCALNILIPYYLGGSIHCYEFGDILYNYLGLSMPLCVKTAIRNAIYFLYDGEDLVYVGRSKAPAIRIKSHISDGKKKFDSYAYVILGNLSLGDINRLEAAYINTHRPKYNKALSHFSITVDSYNWLPCPMRIQKHSVTFMMSGVYDL